MSLKTRLLEKLRFPSKTDPKPVETPESDQPSRENETCVNRNSEIVNPGDDRRRRGKVARLPLDARTLVNTMLDDGEEYTAIVEKLAELGHPGFLTQNISRWKNGGYQTWVADRQQTDLAQIHADSALQLVREMKDATQLCEANSVLLASQTWRALLKFQSYPAEELIGERASKFVQIARAATYQSAERTKRDLANFHIRIPTVKGATTTGNTIDLTKPLTAEQKQQATETVVHIVEETIGISLDPSRAEILPSPVVGRGQGEGESSAVVAPVAQVSGAPPEAECPDSLRGPAARDEQGTASDSMPSPPIETPAPPSSAPEPPVTLHDSPPNPAEKSSQEAQSILNAPQVPEHPDCETAAIPPEEQSKTKQSAVAVSSLVKSAIRNLQSAMESVPISPLAIGSPAQKQPRNHVPLFDRHGAVIAWYPREGPGSIPKIDNLAGFENIRGQTICWFCGKNPYDGEPPTHWKIAIMNEEGRIIGWTPHHLPPPQKATPLRAKHYSNYTAAWVEERPRPDLINPPCGALVG